MESAQHLINVYLYRERKNNLIVVNEIVMKRLHVQSAASRHLHVNGKMHFVCVLNRNISLNILRRGLSQYKVLCNSD